MAALGLCREPESAESASSEGGKVVGAVEKAFRAPKARRAGCPADRGAAGRGADYWFGS